MLTLQHITKTFNASPALENVSATFRPGRVHGVLGENGAGKTTLMRIAAGLTAPDAGTIRLDDRELPPGSPRAATRAGIALVHQHFMLVPTLTVIENCLLGRRDQPQLISRRAAARRIADLGRRIGLEVDPHATVETLSVGEQQRVEIVRALTEARRVLILDEPTAVLAPQETDQLFTALDRLRRDGLAIVFISHKLGEVERICDDLTILRRGRVVYSGLASALTQAQMAEHMVGEAIAPLTRSSNDSAAHEPAPSASEEPFTPEAHSPRKHDSTRIFAAPTSEEVGHPGGIDRLQNAKCAATLELREVYAADPHSRRALHDINLTIRPGEILGVAGVEGNGQDLLAAVIVGALRPNRGRVRLGGHDVTAAGIRARATLGLAHVAEDRLRQALVPAMTLPENLLLKAYRSAPFARAGLLRPRMIREYAARQIARFDVRTGSLYAQARELSGGNQQKVVLARELSGDPRLIVAHNPVRGLDVAATRFVFAQLLEQRQRGAGILLLHSDLDELLSLADRVAVLYNGRLTITDWPAGDRARIGQLMLGAGARMCAGRSEPRP